MFNFSLLGVSVPYGPRLDFESRTDRAEDRMVPEDAALCGIQVGQRNSQFDGQGWIGKVSFENDSSCPKARVIAVSNEVLPPAFSPMINTDRPASSSSNELNDRKLRMSTRWIFIVHLGRRTGLLGLPHATPWADGDTRD